MDMELDTGWVEDIGLDVKQGLEFTGGGSLSFWKLKITRTTG